LPKNQSKGKRIEGISEVYVTNSENKNQDDTNGQRNKQYIFMLKCFKSGY